MITFKDRPSGNLGITFTEMPSIPTGKRRTQFLTIPGRDGVLTIQDDSLEPFSLAFEGHAECDKSTLLSYFNGSGRLIFDLMPDRYYNVKIIDGVTIGHPLGDNRLLKFLVVFEFEPFARLLNNPLIEVGREVAVNNSYELKAYPYFKVEGSGDLIVKKNGSKILEVKNLNGYVELDSELNFIHRGYTSMERNSKGVIPILDVGMNRLEFVGSGITEVFIKYNWRFR